MKRITIKGLCLLLWCTKFHIDIWSRLWVIGLWNVENQIHTHTHTSGRQLKITFLDVLDYSEYLDTNIRKKKNSRQHSFLIASSASQLPQWGSKNVKKLYLLIFIHDGTLIKNLLDLWYLVWSFTSCASKLTSFRHSCTLYIIYSVNWIEDMESVFLSQIKRRLRIMSDRSQNMNSIWRSTGRKATSSNECEVSCLSEAWADITRVEVVASPCDVNKFS